MARPKRKIPLEELEYDVVKEWEADGFRWAILKIRNYESNARITVKNSRRGRKGAGTVRSGGV